MLDQSKKSQVSGNVDTNYAISNYIILLGATPEVSSTSIAWYVEYGNALQAGEWNGSSVTLWTYSKFG